MAPIGNPNENAAGDGKMACINFPTVVAALTLYNNVPADRVLIRIRKAGVISTVILPVRIMKRRKLIWQKEKKSMNGL